MQPPSGRTQRALWGALFTYGQFALSLGAAFFVTPLILRTLGSRTYGLWLSSGELLGYFLLLDFGVFAVLPWLIARADGEKQPGEIRRLLAQGAAVALLLAAGLLLAIWLAWSHLPRWLRLSGEDWQGLSGPLLWLAALLAIQLPLNLFGALLAGLQDARFTGGLNLAKAALAPLLTAGLLLHGQGLGALAVGAALLAPLGGAASFLRARRIAPELLRDWPRPTWLGAARLFRESVGAWLGGAGVQMMERSSAAVLAFLGQPAAAPVLVCTARMGQTLTQMAWVMPDNALVGFAQLGGEGNPARMREVALSIVRLTLILAALMACLTLVLNPAFVRVWVGAGFFGGMPLNALLAAEIIMGSITHALAIVPAVQGHRLAVGAATLGQGVLYLALAVALTRWHRLEGLIVADLLAPLFSTWPVCLWLFWSALGISLWELGKSLSALLLLRAGPCLAAAWAYGWWRGGSARLPELIGAGAAMTLLYLKIMAPPLAAFPLPATAALWLRRLRIVPAA